MDRVLNPFPAHRHHRPAVAPHHPLAARTPGPDPLVLPDGAPVRFRRARAGDEATLVALYEDLSPQSRYTRYCQAVPRLTADRRREIGDLTRGPVWLAHQGGRCVGEARLVAGRGGEWHVAMAVADGFQRRGVGRRLGELLLADPEARHRDVMVSMLATNGGAVRLARQAGFELDLDHGTVEGRLRRAPDAHRSRLVER